MEKHPYAWLREKRFSAGYDSARAFALENELSPSYYWEVEAGKKMPSGPKALKIARALDFDMSLFYAHLVPLEETEGPENK